MKDIPGRKPTKMTLFDDARRRKDTLNRPKRLRADLKRKYDITLELYDAIAEAQGGACAICGRVKPYGQRLSVDHVHATGYVRGLLCKPCNMAVGLFHDDPVVMQAALDYIQFHKEFSGEEIDGAA